MRQRTRLLLYICIFAIFAIFYIVVNNNLNRILFKINFSGIIIKILIVPLLTCLILLFIINLVIHFVLFINENTQIGLIISKLEFRDDMCNLPHSNLLLSDDKFDKVIYYMQVNNYKLESTFREISDNGLTHIYRLRELRVLKLLLALILIVMCLILLKIG